MFRGPFQARDKRVAGRLRNGDRCHLRLATRYPGVGPGGLSIHSIGAGIYLALVPPAIILVITCAVTGIPAAMVIWLSEKLGMRSFLFFGCAGGAIGTLSQAVVFRTLSNFTWFFVVVGFLAGLGYWIVAGRHAGRDAALPGEPA